MIKLPYGPINIDQGYDDYYLELPRALDPKKYTYVVGLMFTNNRKNVLLILKTHPEWQANKLNGTGGKVDPNEMVRQCMVREHLKETGIDTVGEQWDHLCTLDGADYRVYYFVTFDDKALGARQTTDEKSTLCRITSVGNVGWTELSTKNTELIYNLKWIIPMALDETIKLPLIIGDNN